MSSIRSLLGVPEAVELPGWANLTDLDPVRNKKTQMPIQKPPHHMTAGKS